MDRVYTYTNSQYTGYSSVQHNNIQRYSDKTVTVSNLPNSCKVNDKTVIEVRELYFKRGQDVISMNWAL